MIVDAAPPLYGGAGRQALLLAEELEKSGIAAELWSRKKDRVIGAVSPKVKFIGPFLRNRSLSNALFALNCFVRLMITRADVVHIHGAFYYGFSAALAAHIRRIPIVLKVTLLGADDPVTVSNLHAFGLPIGQIMVRQFHFASTVIALNDEIDSLLSEWNASLPVAKIPNGIKLSARTRSLNRESVPDRSDVPRVIFTGILSRRKGVDTLLKAWPIVRNTLPAAQLYLLGPAGDVTSDRLSPEANGIDGIAWLGRVPSEDVELKLAQADVFVLPSRSEGLPNSLIEAMGSGLACVSSNIAVNMETGGDAVLYCDPEDAESVAAAILDAWHSRSMLAAASLRRAKDFDIERVTGAYLVLYESITGSTRKLIGRRDLDQNGR